MVLQQSKLPRSTLPVALTVQAGAGKNLVKVHVVCLSSCPEQLPSQQLPSRSRTWRPVGGACRVAQALLAL